MPYIKYNRHPKGLLVKDCMVRAISTVLNKDYLETRRDLNRAAKELGYGHYSEHNFIFDYLKDYERLIFKATTGQPRMKLADFVKEYPIGTYIVSVRKHVVAVVDGYVLDSWDSCYLTAYTAWKITPGTSLSELGIDSTTSVEARKRIFI